MSSSSRISGGADLHLRPHGARPAARAGRSSPPWPRSRWPASRLLLRPSRAAIRSWRTSPRPTVDQALGNLEGKEMRFGVVNSALWAVVTTDASNGSVNSMHDSYTPIGGLVPLVNIQLGEVIFGGVGAGLYGMLVFVLLSVFIAGLMVGRTPEYLGKKIEQREMKLAMLYVLIFPLRHPRLHRLVGGRRIRSVLAQQQRRRTASARSSTRSAAARQQRLGLRGPQRQHALVQHNAGHHHAGRPLPHDHPGVGHRWLAGGQEDRAAVSRHLPDQRGAVRRACWSASSSSSARSPFSRRCASGPIVEHFLAQHGKLY